ncbi:MAG: TonB-dependent receptor, partial [Spirosomataceae bacterium]
ITVEAFNKVYSNYPISTTTGISLANQGGDFGAIGNERTLSIGEGRSRGLEFFFQQKLTKNIFGVFSYTLFESEFSGADGKLISSSWDTRNIISSQLGRKFKKGWEMGLKWLYQGGSPFTPFDLESSRQNYLLLGTGTIDFNRLNTDRLPAFSRFDFRLNKKWNYKKWTLDVFIDIQNAFVQS